MRYISYYIINEIYTIIIYENSLYEIMSESRDRGKGRKRKSMTKKGHQKFSASEWKFFPKKVI